MKINEIFCSVQGEGHFTGTPSVFIRTSGCNLCCNFCDTMHDEGQEISVGEIVDKALAFAPRHAVLTGGEPTLQHDLQELVDALHEAGFFVQIETNGTIPIPATIDWVTCSPKILDKTVLRSPDEVKVVFEGQDLKPYEQAFHPKVWSLQPCDTGDKRRNDTLLEQTLQYVTRHPQWNLSLQTHKLIGIK